MYFQLQGRLQRIVFPNDGGAETETGQSEQCRNYPQQEAAMNLEAEDRKSEARIE